MSVEVDRSPRRVRPWLYRSVVAVHRPWITVDEPGRLGKLPDPLIFALNHNNAFESIGVPANLIALRGGRTIHFLVDWMFLHIPVIGWLMREMGPVPVYTKPARSRMGESYRESRRGLSPIDGALKLLDGGHSVGLFPEGTRNPDPAILMRGRAGIGRLVLRTEAPIVPVGIRYLAARRRGRVPAIGRLLVRVGEPLAFVEQRRAYRSLQVAAGGRAALARNLGREVVDEIMSAIGRLCDKRYPHAAAPDTALPLSTGRLVPAGGGAS